MTITAERATAPSETVIDTTTFYVIALTPPDGASCVQCMYYNAQWQWVSPKVLQVNTDTVNFAQATTATLPPNFTPPVNMANDFTLFAAVAKTLNNGQENNHNLVMADVDNNALRVKIQNVLRGNTRGVVLVFAQFADNQVGNVSKLWATSDPEIQNGTN